MAVHYSGDDWKPACLSVVPSVSVIHCILWRPCILIYYCVHVVCWLLFCWCVLPLEVLCWKYDAVGGDTCHAVHSEYTTCLPLMWGCLTLLWVICCTITICDPWAAAVPTCVQCCLLMPGAVEVTFYGVDAVVPCVCGSTCLMEVITGEPPILSVTLWVLPLLFHSLCCCSFLSCSAIAFITWWCLPYSWQWCLIHCLRAHFSRYSVVVGDCCCRPLHLISLSDLKSVLFWYLFLWCWLLYIHSENLSLSQCLFIVCTCLCSLFYLMPLMPVLYSVFSAVPPYCVPVLWCVCLGVQSDGDTRLYLLTCLQSCLYIARPLLFIVLTGSCSWKFSAVPTCHRLLPLCLHWWAVAHSFLFIASVMLSSAGGWCWEAAVWWLLHWFSFVAVWPLPLHSAIRAISLSDDHYTICDVEISVSRCHMMEVCILEVFLCLLHWLLSFICGDSAVWKHSLPPFCSVLFMECRLCLILFLYYLEYALLMPSSTWRVSLPAYLYASLLRWNLESDAASGDACRLTSVPFCPSEWALLSFCAWFCCSAIAVVKAGLTFSRHL